MAHPLEDVINQAHNFLLIGDSSDDRFPGLSYAAYTKANKRFYCLDLGGLTQSRGPIKGGKVYASVDELPDDRGDLAIIWVKPRVATHAVEQAHLAGARRIWFSFGSGYPEAVERAKELGIQVLEIGRCPVYYLHQQPPMCAAHTLMVKLTGLHAQAPRTEPDVKQREIA
ncbi:MAG: putative CoA-binding protein [Kiritimatiellia bacterium]|jgi:predicted CoA-binding protein